MVGNLALQKQVSNIYVVRLNYHQRERINSDTLKTSLQTSRVKRLRLSSATGQAKLHVHVEVAVRTTRLSHEADK